MMRTYSWHMLSVGNFGLVTRTGWITMEEKSQTVGSAGRIVAAILASLPEEALDDALVQIDIGRSSR